MTFCKLLYDGAMAVLGLALGGGGARGFAHLGVLKGLEEMGISVDCIAGTSMGAVVGALYALHPDAEAVKVKISEFLRGERFAKLRLRILRELDFRYDQKVRFFQRLAGFLQKEMMLQAVLVKPSVIPQERALEVLRSLLGEGRVEDTKLPFAAVAVDLSRGERVVLKEGPLAEAVLASASVVGVLPPVKWGSRLLVDGGVLSMVPVEAVRELGAEVVVAVDVGKELTPLQFIGSGIEGILRSMEVMSYALCEREVKSADLVLRPEVSSFHWTEFERFEEGVMKGEEAVRRKARDLRVLRRFGGLFRLLRKVRSFRV